MNVGIYLYNSFFLADEENGQQEDGADSDNETPFDTNKKAEFIPAAQRQ